MLKRKKYLVFLCRKIRSALYLIKVYGVKFWTYLKYYRLRLWSNDEKQICCGTLNPEKIFYVIRRKDNYVGLFSYFTTVLGHLNRAIEMGYEPIIDMQFYDNIYLSKELKELYRKNAWCIFFKQVSSKSLTEVYHSKNVVLSYVGVAKGSPQASMEFLLGKTGKGGGGLL